MGRPELGTKCTCSGCDERFYDLNRAPAICPKCGALQAPQTARPTWPERGVAASRRLHRPREPVPADEDTPVMTDAEDDDEEDEDIAESEDDDVETVIDPDRDATPD